MIPTWDQRAMNTPSPNNGMVSTRRIKRVVSLHISARDLQLADILPHGVRRSPTWRNPFQSQATERCGSPVEVGLIEECVALLGFTGTI